MSKASAADAVEANLFAFFQHLRSWPRLEVHDDPRWLWTVSDVQFPLFNSVLRARLDDGAADAAIESRIRACEARRVPMLWWTGPSTRPYDLGARLERRGFLLEPARGMAANLDAFRREDPPDAPITVAPVEDRATLATWCEVLCDGFGAPRRFGDAFADLAAAIGLADSSSFRHFLGHVRGEPAATCSLFLGAGVAGIYDVATLPECRRRGLGAAVTRAAAAFAARQGYRVAILHSSNAGASLYRALGFEDVCAIGQYVWAPQNLKR